MDIGFVSEPVSVPLSGWLGSGDGRAALTWAANPALPLTLCFRGGSCVAGLYGDIVCAACYCSPNTNISNFHDLLAELDTVMTLAREGSVSSPPNPDLRGF